MKRRSPLVWVLVVAIAVVVIGYGAVMALSLSSVSGHIEQATTTYETIETSIEEADFATTLSAVHELADEAQVISDDLNRAQWHVASVIPVVGNDVRCGQGVANISNRLANEALMPVLDIIETAAADISSTDITSLSSIGGTIERQITAYGKLVDAIAQARVVLRQCHEEADKLPTAHSAEINEFATGLRTTISRAELLFDEFDKLAGLPGTTTS